MSTVICHKRAWRYIYCVRDCCETTRHEIRVASLSFKEEGNFYKVIVVPSKFDHFDATTYGPPLHPRVMLHVAVDMFMYTYVKERSL